MVAVATGSWTPAPPRIWPRIPSDVATTLTAFFAFVSTQFGRPIHAFQTDNGKEFDNITIRSLLATHGAIFRLTCPYTSSQNGRAERMLRTLNDCVRTLLFHASMPPRFWPDALATATLLVNIRPCRVRWFYTPHHLLYGAPPTYDDLRIFGCRCYPNTAATAAHKLAPRSLPCVFLGYPANTKGYRCYDPVSHRVLTSRHVYFDELVFPFQQDSWRPSDAPRRPPSAAARPDRGGPQRRPRWSSASLSPAPRRPVARCRDARRPGAPCPARDAAAPRRPPSPAAATPRSPGAPSPRRPVAAAAAMPRRRRTIEPVTRCCGGDGGVDGGDDDDDDGDDVQLDDDGDVDFPLREGICGFLPAGELFSLGALRPAEAVTLREDPSVA
ncbi:hypothetical protein QYE76_034510 [Lolium multiflorum]|uniref:Integrase catalytic domain-containing protein n=1 Tax=Lolium multiflorum TaxID=4521 RepID=A0AAD8QY73_LOLMU|nr:hypothetical protein QYE76_034510 [Lolium multiflorum]